MLALDLRGRRGAGEKLPLLSRLAPTQSEPPFLVAQLIVMAISRCSADAL
jgi:hypothetical protein